MPARTTFPAVHVLEGAAVPPPIEGAPTSDVALVGHAPRGPVLEAVRVEGAAAYGRTFGAARARSLLGDAVRHFFANGGRRAWVVRLPPRRADPSGTADWAAALDAVDPLPLLALPGVSACRPLAVALAYAGRRGALLLVDLPRDCTTVAAAARWRRGLTDLAPGARAAAYLPWLADPGGTHRTPPSGAMAGVYGRVDAARGVWTAPAGADAALAGGVVPAVAFDARDVEALAAEGLNVVRRVPGAGTVPWGARTTWRPGDGDDALRYVPVRRLLLFVEASVARGLSWAAFERNDERLWARVRGAVEQFLDGLWRQGALVGSRPRDAYFVRCDRTTMTQAELDEGRLVCLVGAAVVRAAEFVIVRIGQWACRDC